MRALRLMLMTLLTTALLCATAYGAGFAWQHRDSLPSLPGEPSAARAAQDPEAPPVGTSSEDPTDLSTPPTSRETEPEFRLSPGDRGDDVRELQARLFQLAWLPEETTGRYDRRTRAAVAGFQAKRGLPSTGVTDERTWRRLVQMTDQPTYDQMFNILRPGPPLLQSGDTGDAVRDLQARLKSIQWLFGDVTGTFDAETADAVRGFQHKREIPVTGKVDQRTLDRLHAMTLTPTHEQKHNIVPQPGALDPRCTTGRALCVDKSTNFLSWVVHGEVRETLEVRFGSEELPTREGLFSVYRKSRDHVSSLYDTPMPFAMFFSGGQAVHYSPDFAATGYNGASHGCVNVRDYNAIAALYDQVQVGDKVVVYWS